MKPSRKYLSLPIISLREGQHIGYVKSLILSAQTKTVAALVIDPKGFFKDQRIIPYSKVVSVGDDAITIDKGSHVEKTASLPEILDLLKEKFTVLGSKVVTESGKTLGIVDEYFIDPENGQITGIELSGGKIEGFLNGKALLGSEYILTIGKDIVITQRGSESALINSDRGLSETIKTALHSTGQFASETTHSVGRIFRRNKASQSNPISTAKEEDLPQTLLKDQDAVPEQNPAELKTADVGESADKEPLG